MTNPDISPGSSEAHASDRGAPMPLSDAQSGIWYAQRLDPLNPVFNTAQTLEIRGPLDVEAFRLAVERTAGEADALSIRVVDQADGPAQVLDPALRPRLRIIDLSGSADPVAEADAEIARDVTTPIDLERQPLAAQHLYVLGPDHFLWYQRAHHIAVDGYGMALLVRRVCDLYTARVLDRQPVTAPFAPLQQLLAADREYRDSEKRQKDRAYWLERMEGSTGAASLVPGRAVTAHSYLRSVAELPDAVSIAIGELCARAKVVWPDAVTALVAAYLQRHIEGDEVTVGVTTMNRLGGVAARVPAMVMNILPLRLEIDEDAPLADVLSGNARQLAAARRHGRYRGEQLRRDLHLLGEDRRLYGPLINILPFEEPASLPGLVTTPRTIATGPVDDITLEVRADPRGAKLQLEIQANPDRYGQADIDAHLARLATFLERAGRCDRLADVPTLTPSEHDRWVIDVNRTDHPVESITLTGLIERTMRTAPDATALVFEGRSMSYAELDERTARLARELTARGIGADRIVGVALHRSFELVVSLVAILRAGGAYLPIDPDHPPDWIARTMESARPSLVIANAATRGTLPADVELLVLEELPEVDCPTGNEAAPAIGAKDAAYVIYTSGSTGTPKGVVIEHEAIVNRLEWMRTQYGVGPGERIIQKTPSTFDVSVWEFFLPLITGATLVIAPPGAHRDPAILARLMQDEDVTTAHFVPSMLTIFLEEPTAGDAPLRKVFCSGEALPAGLRDRFHTVFDAELHNLYGPTEAAVDVTYWPADADDRSDPVPIGYPVWNTRMYVLDDRMRAVPPGVTGHLYIGGVQLARGYLGRDDLTAERFIPDPFRGGDARIYRTGDLARWRDDGAIEFLGRSDFQVKIRGNRVELGQIEAVLLEMDGVGRAVVVAREDRPGDQRLVAYLVGDDSADSPAEDDLRERLASSLPDYMVPSAFVWLDALPLSHSGKLDRKALPVPDQQSRPEGRPPSTPTERRLAPLFAEVLGIDSVSVDDDFFLLGGHSLLAARLAAAVREATDREVRLGTIFAHPTVARLAAHLDRMAESFEGWSVEGEGLAPVIHLIEAPAGSPPPLFCIHPAGGISWPYRALGSMLDPRRDVHGIQARGLDPGAPLPGTLSELAADYVALIREIRPRGPFHLAGWSVGGIIAQEMAVQLERAGDRVGVLAMLDAYPSDCWRDQADPEERDALRALLQIAGVDSATVPESALTRAGIIDVLRQSEHPLGRLSDTALSGVVRVVRHNNLLVRRHRHERFGGRLVHFRAALDHGALDIHPRLWQPYVGEIEVHDVDSLHPHMILPEPAEHIAGILARYLSEADT